MPTGSRLVAAPLAALLLLGIGQGLVADTIVVDSNNATPGDWETGSGSGSGSGLTVPVGSAGWVYTDLRTDGSIGINTGAAGSSIPNAIPPFSGNGSVVMETTSGTGMASIQLNSTDPNGFGLLKNLNAFSYSWYVDSSSNPSLAYAAPVARLIIQSPDGSTQGQLVWEPYFNGYSTTNPKDQWTTSNAYNNGDGQFSTYGSALGQLSGVNASLDTWVNGGVPGNDNPEAYGDWTVIGINMGIGSGVNGTLIGAVDNLTIGFDGQTATTYDFEVVPEPSSIVMAAIGGIGLLGAFRRRRAASA